MTSLLGRSIGRALRRPRPRVSMHVDGGVLTIDNTGRCPATITDLSIVPVDRDGEVRRFAPGAVLADLDGTTVGVHGPVTLDVGDTLHALIEEHMIVRPVDDEGSYEVYGCAVVTGRPHAQFTTIASFRSLTRQQPSEVAAAERELRARLMWGFS